jgi:hypothetical protein
MSPQTYRSTNRDERKAHSVTRSPARVVLQHDMTVIASSVTDVVTSAGGWLFDRRMAGWQVNVLLSDRVGERALRILGAKALDLDGGLDAMADDPNRAATVVVAADVYAADERVRRFVSTSDRFPRRKRQRRLLPAERGGKGVQGTSSDGGGHAG